MTSQQHTHTLLLSLSLPLSNQIEPDGVKEPNVLKCNIYTRLNPIQVKEIGLSICNWLELIESIGFVSLKTNLWTLNENECEVMWGCCRSHLLSVWLYPLIENPVSTLSPFIHGMIAKSYTVIYQGFRYMATCLWTKYYLLHRKNLQHSHFSDI